MLSCMALHSGSDRTTSRRWKVALVRQLARVAFRSVRVTRCFADEPYGLHSVVTLTDLRRVTRLLWVLSKRCQHRAPTALPPWPIRRGPGTSSEMLRVSPQPWFDTWWQRPDQERRRSNRKYRRAARWSDLTNTCAVGDGLPDHAGAALPHPQSISQQQNDNAQDKTTRGSNKHQRKTETRPFLVCSVSLPGFRQQRAPMMLERRFRSHING